MFIILIMQYLRKFLHTNGETKYFQIHNRKNNPHTQANQPTETGTKTRKMRMFQRELLNVERGTLDEIAACIFL